MSISLRESPQLKKETCGRCVSDLATREQKKSGHGTVEDANAARKPPPTVASRFAQSLPLALVPPQPPVGLTQRWPDPQAIGGVGHQTPGYAWPPPPLALAPPA
jgi:hypothetical protein